MKVLRSLGGTTALPLALFCLLTLPFRANAITSGQVDTFQDGTTMGWQEGGSSPNPPTNVATGGPAGTGDKYLENKSSGGGGAGSKMVMFNSVQWTGNYNAAGVGRLTADMSNFGSTALHMRIAIRGGPGSSNYASVAAVDLPADGAWHPVAFDLTPSAMTNINGGDPLANVLTSVAELRILSAATPSSNGDSVEGTLGMDNLRAIDVAALSLRVTEILLTDVVPRVRFTTVSGRSYRVERKNALSETMWTQVVNAENVSGTGGIVEVSDTEPGAGNLPARFYHVVLLAP